MLPDIDLFASTISRQVPTCISWKLNPFSKGRDVLKITWTHLKIHGFPTFAAIGRVLNKVQKEKSDFITNYHNLANTITVFTAVTIHSANTIVSIKNSEPFIRFKQRKASLDRAGKLITPSVDSLREILHAEAIFGRLYRYYRKCQKISTNAHYEST